MERLSRPVHDMREHYEVVVVGSGYGGGIAASRLARAGRSVCVLERGKELHPGDYPNGPLNAAPHMQARTPIGHIGSPTALFNFYLGPDISVVTGAGLGGTSLINANVALRANPVVFQDPRWPEELRDNGADVLEPYYKRAEQMLGTTHYPAAWPELPKYRQLARSASGLGAAAEPAPLNVTFEAGSNAAGVWQEACTLCGDCISGCNHGAKNTVLMNYLPDAHAHGANIVTEVQVRTVNKRSDGKWRIDFVDLAAGRRRFGATTQFVTADVVVLAGGSLGSTEILLRSREAGLELSPKLGLSFTGNGDVLAFAFDTDASTRPIGLGARPSTDDTLVGACINGMIQVIDPKNHENDLLIQEGSVPNAVGAVVGPVLALSAAIFGSDETHGWRRVARRSRQIAGSLLGPRRGPIDRSLVWLVMSIDDDMGELVLDNDRLVVRWRGVEDAPFVTRDNEAVRRATEEVRGTFLPNPTWTSPVGNMLLTVQPLGGCDMGDHAEHGVVNHKGQVFAGSDGTDVHKGLYVADGAVVPTPIGANPSLTISALAERICEHLVDEMTGTPQGAHDDETRPPRPGLRFSERMAGFFSTRVTEPGNYREGWEQGKADASPLEFVLTITYPDVEAVLRDQSVVADVSGTVVAAALSPHRLQVTGGSFRLFVPDPSHVETFHMIYELDLATEDDQCYHLRGFKLLRERGSLKAWPDSTTLYTEVQDEKHKTLGFGILRIRPADFARQVPTIDVVGEPDDGKRKRYRVEFLKTFVGRFLNLYGGALDEASSFPAIPAGTKLPITGARRSKFRRKPENWWCDADGTWRAGKVMGDNPGEGARLQLFRFNGGDKGPVMMAPGFAMSATSYLADTTEISLAEYLYKNGYDVWLFDSRTGIQLPSAREPFTLDEVAKQDWPAGVDRVRDVSGKSSVQVFAHCTGSLTFQMAMLAGLHGVRSGVCSQVTVNLRPGRQMRVKLKLPVDGLLKRLKLETLEPDDRRTLRNYLIDVLLRVLPMPREERCGQALCRWINAVYGITHRHAQLNDATHRALHEMFGVGDLTAARQFGESMRTGHVVDSEGNDTYRTHPQRLAIPLLFLHGDKNSFFLPEGSEETVEWLRSMNDPGLYKRELLPGYAHLDTFLGKNAHIEVYPKILDHLEETATA
ncbi:MAG: GMC family oxidoreductase N-terminal domain-containing protein [Actinomycetota bacterium]